MTAGREARPVADLEVSHPGTRVDEIREPSQSDLMYRAQAYIVTGDLDAAREDLRRAIYVGGPRVDYLYQALGQLERAAKEADGG
jgi:hypothetical protein